MRGRAGISRGGGASRIAVHGRGLLPVTCNCSKCPVKGTFKCPKKELEDRAYYFKTLLDQERLKKVVKK